MTSFRYFLVPLIALCCSGCLWFGHKAVKPTAIMTPETVSVQILRNDAWSSGGSLVFIPFTPGANAEAGPEVDRLSLMIVKGAADFFAEKSGVFALITDGNADSARFVIEGRVEEYDAGSRWKSIGLGKKDVTLRIKSEMRERKTGEVVALISGFKAFKSIKDSERVAYGLGQSIGEKVQH